jgi:phosphopantetheinyl transferase
MPLNHFYNKDNCSLIIWEVNEDEQFFLSKFILTDEESKILEFKKNTLKKIEFLSIRYLLRLLKINPNDLYYTKLGAPKLKSKTNISISHCMGYSSILVSDDICGVDIETFRNKIFKIKDRFVNDDDIKNIDSSSVNDLTIVWSLKESVFKAENIPGLNFKEQIFIKSIEKESKIAEILVKKLNVDKIYKSDLLIKSKYICTTVFSND